MSCIFRYKTCYIYPDNIEFEMTLPVLKNPNKAPL